MRLLFVLGGAARNFVLLLQFYVVVATLSIQVVSIKNWFFIHFRILEKFYILLVRNFLKIDPLRTVQLDHEDNYVTIKSWRQCFFETFRN